MNTRQSIQPAAGPSVLSLSFSFEHFRFIAGMSDGLRIFRTDNCLTTYHPSMPFNSPISIAEVLDDRYIAFVCSRKTDGVGPNHFVFWDLISERQTARFDLHEPILGLRLTTKWLAVILEERTIIFQYHDLGIDGVSEAVRAPNIAHSLHRTAPNPHALASLSQDMLLLPAQNVGQIQLITLKPDKMSTKRVLRAHNSALSCVTLSDDCSLLATASEQGTLIRVYNAETLDQIAEHRRGIDHAVMYSLAFSPGNRWIASTSDKGTLHVFDLRPPDAAEVVARGREARERQHRHSQAYAGHRLSGNTFDKDSLSGVSTGQTSPAPSTAVGTGAGAGYQGSVQEYYGLRPPPTSASPPATHAAVSAMAALRASPLAPRIFKDSRSVASAPFYIGEDPPHWQGGPAYRWTTTPNGTKKKVKNPVLPLPSDPKGRPPKGKINFAPDAAGDDDGGCVIYVVGGGSDHRWEMFKLVPTSEVEGGAASGWTLVHDGFRRYLTRQFVD